jgi:starch synthase
MKILMVASEAAPFLRTSDAATVVAELCSALCREGHDARLVIPFYRRLSGVETPRCIVESLDVPLCEFFCKASISRVDHKLESGRSLPVYLVKDEFYLGRENPYGYLDDYERFIFFTRAVVDMLNSEAWAQNEDGWRPDVIHGHDWIAGLIPFWLRSPKPGSPSLPPIAFAYTLHNVGFPGQVERLALHAAGLEDQGIYPELNESAGLVSLMARGIWAADVVNTVSPTHAHELTHGTWASGIDQAIKSRKSPVRGIMNGIDDACYDPAFDSQIAQKFSVARLHDRRKNKTSLQRESDLVDDPKVPVLGMVTRLIAEKGLEMVVNALPQLFSKEQVQVVILGALGDFRYQEALAELTKKFPGRMKAFFGFDDRQARRIFAGSDIILVPSLQEPCGLQQMIGMRYGAIPLVSKTGGLVDTVSDWKLAREIGRGFVFDLVPDPFDASRLLGTIHEALDLYGREPGKWEELQRHNMRLDFSWQRPTREYVEVYSEAVNACRERTPLPKGQTIRPDRNQMLVHALLHVSDLATAAGTSDDLQRAAYLKRAARLIRELIHCDGVLIWVEDEAAPHLLRMQAYTVSVNPHPQDMPFPDTIPADLGVRSQGPQYIYYREPAADRQQSQHGFLLSDAAKMLNWQVQLTVPMNARAMTGRIDVFFCDPKREISEEDKGSLSALANGLANTLERVAERDLAEKLLEADRKLMAETTLTKVVDVAVQCAKELVHGDEVTFCPPSGQSYTPPKVDHNVQGNVDDHLVESYLAPIASPVHPLALTAQMLTPQEQKEGELRVWREKSWGFSHRDELALQKLAKQVAAALEATRSREEAERARPAKLQRLSRSMTGFADLNELLQSVVETTAEVLAAEAASLYMVNESGEYLEIKAAAGYHKVHLGQDNTYHKGEGLTAWLWEHGETVKLDSLDALHKHPGWQGRYKKRQGDREPNCFLGIPLKVTDRHSGTAKVIGVLKLEDRPKRQDVGPIFNDEDQRLSEMMANVIATVVYNTQLGQQRLKTLSENLGSLSSALAGSQERQTLMNNIVETIAKVVDADAASLFLADEKRETLVIEAASGYQKGLMAADPKPFYRWGEGVTGRIAETNKAFSANSLADLRKHGSGKPGKYDQLQEGKVPSSFYGLPLNVKGQDKPIGVLKVESLRDRRFAGEDELLLKMMANVIATVVYNVQISENKLAKLNRNVRELSDALAGSQERRTLMNSIVEKIRDVVDVDAASLYLADEKREKLIIEAASGYQKKLMEADPKPFYRWGEGVTGRIAKDNRPFQADSLAELRAKGGSAQGQWDRLQDNRRPESFYGLPLNVRGEDKPIGVLKVESLRPRPFTQEDVLLIQMMGNVIAAVVYNVQISETRLATFSKNLKRLSEVLTPGRQKAQEWFQPIVETISNVFGTDAASLYLLDESTKRLVVAAASGYQRPLIETNAFYELGEGVTGQIMEKNTPIRAVTLHDLRRKGAGSQGPASRGKYDNLQGGNQPNSFYGVPLRVTGEDKPIGVLKFESLRERFFSDETCLLIDMMANVIATVIHNTQLGEQRVGQILRKMGTLSSPLPKACPQVLQEYAEETDVGLINQLAHALAEDLGENPDTLEAEARKLFHARSRMNPELRPAVFGRISSWAQFLHYDRVEWQYALYEAVLRLNSRFADWKQVEHVAAPWIRLKDNVGDAHSFSEAARHFVEEFAGRTDIKTSQGEMDPTGTWYKCILDTESIFGEQVKNILVLLQRQGGLEEEEEKHRLEQFSTQDAQHPYPVLLVVAWNTGQTRKQIEEVREHLKIRQVDIVFAQIEDVLRIMQGAVPSDVLRSTVLRQVTIVSPFITMGAVPETLFFGRDQEIKILTHNPSGHDYAIIGNRRIGKSSLLNRVFSVLKSNQDVRPMRVDCQAVKTQDDFFNSFQIQADVGLTENTPRGFAQCMTNLKRTGQTPILLIDEVDEFLLDQETHGETLVKQWRSLAQGYTCRFMFFGSNVLARQVDNPASKLCSFPEPLTLGCLAEKDARRVLTEPLAKLEVELADGDAIADEVLKLTSCHPRLVQLVGKLLVEAAKYRNERRVSLIDVEKIRDSGAFRDEYLSTMWGIIGPLEKLITLLAPSSEFRLADIETALAARTIIVCSDVASERPGEPKAAVSGVRISSHALTAALKMLQYFSILGESREVYRFIPESFYVIVHSLSEKAITNYIQDSIRGLVHPHRLKGTER